MKKAVKRIETKTYPNDEEGYLSQVTEFDAAGNQLLLIDYLPDGSIENKIDSKYDDNNLLEEKQYTDEETLTDHKCYFRNQDGQIERIEITYQDGSVAIQTHRIDPKTNTETIEELHENGDLEFREVLEYDKDKNLKARDVYDFNNKLKEAFTYTYNEGGLLVNRKQLNPKRKLEIETRYEYNGNGLISYRANLNRKGKLSDFLKVEYDANGQVIKQNFSGKFFFTFEYDAQGNAVLEERYSAGNELEYQSRFEYDDNNQMIKEINSAFVRELHYSYH